MQKITTYLGNLSLKQSILHAILFGLLAGLAFPPINLIPLFILAYCGLFILLQNTKTYRGAFLIGGAFAFGFMSFSFHWIAGALFVDIGTYFWILPLAVFGLPLALSIYYGLAAMLARRLGTQGIRGAIHLASCWFLAEMARAHLFTGFPWDSAGYVWGDVLPILQITHYVGVEGLGLLTILLAIIPATLFEKKKINYYANAIIIGIFIAIGLWGFWRLENTETKFVPNIYLRLINPNIAQKIKWHSGTQDLGIEKIFDLSRTPSSIPITHIIWPETATRYYVAEDYFLRHEMAKLIPPHSARDYSAVRGLRPLPATVTAGAVITGSLRRERDASGQMHYYNSLIAVDAGGNVTGAYDKHHLVPFGEYVPLRHLIPLRAVSQLAMNTDFTSGAGAQTLHISGLSPFSPLICYEVIFSNAVINPTDRPQIMINVTNDAWYAHTIGPAQHFSIARLRAIEEGLPLLRSANGGHTAIIDPLGRIIAHSPPNKEVALDGLLPQALPDNNFISRHKGLTVWLIFTLLNLLAFCVFPKKRG